MSSGDLFWDSTDGRAQIPGLPGSFMLGIFLLMSLAVSDLPFPVWTLYFWEIGKTCDTETVV